MQQQLYLYLSQHWAFKQTMLELQVLIDDMQLHGQITAEEFLKQREEQLDKLFPTAQLLPGACMRAGVVCAGRQAGRPSAACCQAGGSCRSRHATASPVLPKALVKVDGSS